MKSFIPAAMLVALLSLPALAGGPDRLAFSAARFSIKPLESGTDSRAVVLMSLPTTEGFAPNVNVMIQDWPGSLEEYVKLSKGQFESRDLGIKQLKSEGSVAIMEYTGALNGRPLHWYARAEKSGDKVYLATATAMPRQWEAFSVKLKECVDSMRVDEEPKTR